MRGLFNLCCEENPTNFLKPETLNFRDLPQHDPMAWKKPGGSGKEVHPCLISDS
jgi:hypothetical protein